MKNYKTALMLLLSSFPLLGTRSQATALEPEITPLHPEGDGPVSLRPLNRPSDNLFAAHRSHASHASHRSSSGGSATPQPQPRTTPSAPTGPFQGVAPSGSAQPTDPGRPAQVSPTPTPLAGPSLSTSEMLKLQIMRVQIALKSLGLYEGEVNGVLDNNTKSAVKQFQIVKGIEASGLMTTDTLNALAVPAVK